MAERPLYKQNWQGRSIVSFGPKFRLDMNNPTMGLNGTDVYNFYAVTDNNDVCLTGLTEGGTYHIYNDRSIELIAGQKSESNGVDIIITGRNGDICITAEKNGRVRIRAQNIMIDADEDVDIKAGRNITLDSGSGRVLIVIRWMEIWHQKVLVLGNKFLPVLLLVLILLKRLLVVV